MPIWDTVAFFCRSITDNVLLETENNLSHASESYLYVQKEAAAALRLRFVQGPRPITGG
jgi:hypothetical protein